MANKRRVSQSVDIKWRIEERLISDVIKELQEILKEHSFIDEPYLEIDTECEPYSDHEYATVELTGQRWETDSERKKRLREDKRRKEMRKQQYENLKKEFGD